LQNDRIVAGGVADQGEYPSQVKIIGQYFFCIFKNNFLLQVAISFTSEYINYGAGSILNEKYVLTAGHCVDR
jgi:secreted trypsin-like serine protease